MKKQISNNLTQGEVEEAARLLLNYLKTIKTNDSENYNNVLSMVKTLVEKIEKV